MTMSKPCLPLLVFSLICAAACTPVSAATPDPAAIERGRKEFVQACGFCHGNDATGSRAPDLIRSKSVNHDENGETVGPIIRNGRPDKGMPAFPNVNVDDIVAFLHAQAYTALHSAHVPRDYPVENLLTGNAAAGKAFFEGAGKCSGCHSVTGDLKGVAKKYSPIDLQSRFLYPSGVKATAKVTLKSGEQIPGKLASTDEFNIALWDSNGWYRSFPRNAVKVEIQDPLAGHRQLLYQYTDKNVHDLFTYLETLQ
jgi:cytochrome c oxidase cbb3-type subunit 3